MPAWLGIALCAMFVVIGLHRARHRDGPGTLMALGMAVMAPGMAGIGPHLVHGPWWAAGFALVAAWPTLCLARRVGGLPERGELPRGHVAHLVGGLAMIYMCVAGLAFAPSPPPDQGIAGYQLAAVHEHHSGTASLVATGAIGAPESVAVGLFALSGWALAGYFLFSTVCGLTRHRTVGRHSTDTRRGAGGTDGRRVRAPGSPVEAAMGLGTIIMLVVSI